MFNREIEQISQSSNEEFSINGPIKPKKYGKEPLIKPSIVPVDEEDDLETVNIMAQTQDPHSFGENIGDHISLMNVIKGNIGTGLLSMPAVVHRAGLVLGTVSIFLMGILATYLMRMLVNISHDVCTRHGLDRHNMDYTETVFQVMKHGPRPLRKYKGIIKHIVNVFLIITQVGFCCVYVLFISSNIVDLLHQFSPESAFFKHSSTLWLTGFLITTLLVPFSLIKNLGHLSIPSLLANIATVLGISLIYIYCLQDIPNWDNLPKVREFDSALISFGIIIYSFEAISLVLPIESKMKTPENFLPPAGVLNTGMVIVFSIYTSIGFFGFLRFGLDTKETITINIPVFDPIYCLPVRPLFIFSVFVSYLMQFYIPAHIFSRLMEKFQLHRNASDKSRKRNVTVMRIVLVFIIYILSMSIPYLDLMISLIGSLSSSALALIFPPMLDIIHRWRYREDFNSQFYRRFIVNIVLIIFGFLGFLGGTTSTIMGIVAKFHETN
jgi:proton-coupled amino acid transporter